MNEIPEPCRSLDPKRPGRRTRKGRQPRTGEKRKAPAIEWTDLGLETFSISWAGPLGQIHSWIIRRKEPNDLHAEWTDIGRIASDETIGSDMGKPVGCYYVVGVDERGKWLTGRSNILCNWTEAAALDKRFFG